MKPIHKFNNGNSATLCCTCRTIINTTFSDELLCVKCQNSTLELLLELTRTNDDVELISNVIVQSNNFLKEVEDE